MPVPELTANIGSELLHRYVFTGNIGYCLVSFTIHFLSIPYLVDRVQGIEIDLGIHGGVSSLSEEQNVNMESHSAFFSPPT